MKGVGGTYEFTDLRIYGSTNVRVHGVRVCVVRGSSPWVRKFVDS